MNKCQKDVKATMVEARGPKSSVISWPAVYQVLEYKGYERMLPAITKGLDDKKDGLRAGEYIHAVHQITGQIVVVTYNDIMSVLEQEFDL